MILQPQTLALDDATREELRSLVTLISLNRDDPEKLARLIAEHDEIVKRATLKAYDPRDEGRIT